LSSATSAHGLIGSYLDDPQGLAVNDLPSIPLSCEAPIQGTGPLCANVTSSNSCLGMRRRLLSGDRDMGVVPEAVDCGRGLGQDVASGLDGRCEPRTWPS
jgi:hypothetical protein